jgi:hypothetical protein
MVKHNVNQACFNMQHGGTWKGLLQLASSDKTIINNRCDDVAYTIIVFASIVSIYGFVSSS